MSDLTLGVESSAMQVGNLLGLAQNHVFQSFGSNLGSQWR